jgi:hypothetical protein
MTLLTAKRGLPERGAEYRRHSNSNLIRQRTRRNFPAEDQFIKIIGMMAARCLPADFCLLSSEEEQKRLCQASKTMDRRCCAYQRRREATQKATGHLRVKILASVKVGLRGGLPCKLVFVRDRRKSDRLALLSTDVDPADVDINRFIEAHCI